MELHAAHVRLLSSVSIMFGTRICLVLASRSIARGGSVAGSPKVHGGDCPIRLHTITVLLDFTRCSPSCSSYIRRTFVRLSCTYNQLTHSHQHRVRILLLFSERTTHLVCCVSTQCLGISGLS
jgi:hypothetical protein